MTKEREVIERCLAVVDAYEASGQKASVWAQASGVSIRELASWCGHARRWRARLQGAAGEPVARSVTGSATGFVAAAMPASPSASVRVEYPGSSGPVALHWPMSHLRELATWLREVAR